MRISDWSSDVCSSDLGAIDADEVDAIRALYANPELTPEQRAEITGENAQGMYAWRHAGLHATFHAQWQALALSDIYLVLADGRIIYSVTQIGRASCRERVCQYVLISVVAVSLITNKTRYSRHEIQTR